MYETEFGGLPESENKGSAGKFHYSIIVVI
jgi:hypothetical protein